MIDLYAQAREVAKAEILKHFAPEVVTVDAYEARAINAAIAKTLELVEQEVRRRLTVEEKIMAEWATYPDSVTYLCVTSKRDALTQVATFLRHQREAK